MRWLFGKTQLGYQSLRICDSLTVPGLVLGIPVKVHFQELPELRKNSKRCVICDSLRLQVKSLMCRFCKTVFVLLHTKCHPIQSERLMPVGDEKRPLYMLAKATRTSSAALSS